MLEEADHSDLDVEDPAPPPSDEKRGRGRPRKHKPSTSTSTADGKRSSCCDFVILNHEFNYLYLVLKICYAKA